MVSEWEDWCYEEDYVGCKVGSEVRGSVGCRVSNIYNECRGHGRFYASQRSRLHDARGGSPQECGQVGSFRHNPPNTPLTALPRGLQEARMGID